MARHAVGVDAQTYMPVESQESLLQSFAEDLASLQAEPGTGAAHLTSRDGRSVAIPESLLPVLRQVAESLAQGMGVTVAPLSAMLTTQEAADFLGISRPTLVRILERGELPFEKPGPHRYVRLADLLEFQRGERNRRRETLTQMVKDAEEMGLYEATDGVPPRMR